MQWTLLVGGTNGHQQLLKWMGITELPAGFSVVARRAIPGKAGWRAWYDWLIPRLAKKYRADAVVLTGGIAAAKGRSLRSSGCP
ncbi:hypothetical protein ACQ86N_43560 [Puia sp. P3]|uniref:hypothetical protein n=1 Tax=Puia sp. P3 TaxID=3423952 RepID=UPI003D67AB3A